MPYGAGGPLGHPLVGCGVPEPSVCPKEFLFISLLFERHSYRGRPPRPLLGPWSGGCADRLNYISHHAVKRHFLYLPLPFPECGCQGDGLQVPWDSGSAQTEEWTSEKTKQRRRELGIRLRSDLKGARLSCELFFFHRRSRLEWTSHSPLGSAGGAFPENSGKCSPLAGGLACLDHTWPPDTPCQKSGMPGRGRWRRSGPLRHAVRLPRTWVGRVCVVSLSLAHTRTKATSKSSCTSEHHLALPFK